MFDERRAAVRCGNQKCIKMEFISISRNLTLIKSKFLGYSSEFE